MEKRILGVIPARFKSERLPGKPLADIGGKPMIQHVYEKAILANSLTDVVIATESVEVKEACEKFGANCILTSEAHLSGTSRLCEVVKKMPDYDYYINIQGDQPLLDYNLINEICKHVLIQETHICTLASKATKMSQIDDQSSAKVVLDKDHFALYFSRSLIPFVRGEQKKTWLSHSDYYKHIGMYAFPKPLIKRIFKACNSGSKLESVEKLEQLTWLYDGMKVYVGIVDGEDIPVDTSEDLQKVKKILGV
jgi:3-deoxy-manno-octulosonate cytidylyltransferase (CMP-KDO synthetase)